MFTEERKNELIDFFSSYASDIEYIINKCDNLPEQKKNAWLMINQTQRLVYLADNADNIKKGRDPLKLLFLIICAEAIAKLYKNFSAEGKSWEHVNLFFQELCDSEDFKVLNYALRVEKEQQRETLSAEDVVKYLYKVRCDVVHEGYYWGFFFKERGITVTFNEKDNEIILPNISYDFLRNMIIKGAINAIKLYLR